MSVHKVLFFCLNFCSFLAFVHYGAFFFVKWFSLCHGFPRYETFPFIFFFAYDFIPATHNMSFLYRDYTELLLYLFMCSPWHHMYIVIKERFFCIIIYARIKVGDVRVEICAAQVKICAAWVKVCAACFKIGAIWFKTCATWFKIGAARVKFMPLVSKFALFGRILRCLVKNWRRLG